MGHSPGDCMSPAGALLLLPVRAWGSRVRDIHRPERTCYARVLGRSRELPWAQEPDVVLIV